MPPGPYRAMTCRGRELNVDHRQTFLTTQGHGGPPRMSGQPDAGATSETAQTWKTIHTKHILIHTNKANMEWWLRRPNDIRGPCGPKVSRHLSYIIWNHDGLFKFSATILHYEVFYSFVCDKIFCLSYEMFAGRDVLKSLGILFQLF